MLNDHVLSRRGFLALGAASLLAGCAPAKAKGQAIQVGYVPIACCSGLLAAETQGIFQASGLDIQVRKFAGWAELMTSYKTGEIDAAQMLAPMPHILGETPSLQLNTGGQGLVLAPWVKQVDQQWDLAGARLGIPFHYSMHNLLLRDYLSAQGLNPDSDVELRIMRPADMVAGIRTKIIDGYFGPEPFITRSVKDGATLAVRGTEILDNHPCCVFVTQNPQLSDLVAAGVDWADNNREELAKAVATPAYVNQPEELVIKALGDPTTLRFDTQLQPRAEEWIHEQLLRWRYL